MKSLSDRTIQLKNLKENLYAKNDSNYDIKNFLGLLAIKAPREGKRGQLTLPPKWEPDTAVFFGWPSPLLLLLLLLFFAPQSSRRS